MLSVPFIYDRMAVFKVADDLVHSFLCQAHVILSPYQTFLMFLFFAKERNFHLLKKRKKFPFKQSWCLLYICSTYVLMDTR